MVKILSFASTLKLDREQSLSSPIIFWSNEVEKRERRAAVHFQKRLISAGKENRTDVRKIGRLLAVYFKTGG